MFGGFKKANIFFCLGLSFSTPTPLIIPLDNFDRLYRVNLYHFQQRRFFFLFNDTTYLEGHVWDKSNMRKVRQRSLHPSAPRGSRRRSRRHVRKCSPCLARELPTKQSRAVRLFPSRDVIGFMNTQPLTNLCIIRHTTHRLGFQKYIRLKEGTAYSGLIFEYSHGAWTLQAYIGYIYIYLLISCMFKVRFHSLYFIFHYFSMF